MSSTVGARYVNGTEPCTAAAIEIRTVGFVPKKVVVENLDTRAKAEWNDTMGDDTAMKTVAAGTRTDASADGITPLTGVNPGFQIGALADVNDSATESMRWEAWG